MFATVIRIMHLSLPVKVVCMWAIIRTCTKKKDNVITSWRIYLRKRLLDRSVVFPSSMVRSASKSSGRLPSHDTAYNLSCCAVICTRDCVRLRGWWYARTWQTLWWNWRAERWRGKCTFLTDWFTDRKVSSNLVIPLRLLLGCYQHTVSSRNKKYWIFYSK